MPSDWHTRTDSDPAHVPVVTVEGSPGVPVLGSSRHGGVSPRAVTAAALRLALALQSSSSSGSSSGSSSSSLSAACAAAAAALVDAFFCRLRVY
jgi:hypothetical protein